MLKLLEEKLRKEREVTELSLLEDDFFLGIREHMVNLESRADPISAEKLRLMQQVLEDLIDLRAEKIFYGRRKNMLRQESALAEFASTFKKFKKDVLESLLQKESTAQKVMVLQDIPQFYGPDLKVLGPYKRGEKVLLDETIATLLKEKGLIEQVV
jgi:DNA replication initiation complex subunit (GINS family)